MIVAAFLLAAVFTRSLERVGTIVPSESQSVYDARAVQLVYETILSIDYTKRPYELRPGFCELPKMSADSLGYTFKTRNGASAELVVATLESLRDGKKVSPNGWIMKNVDTVRAIDAEMIEVRLKKKTHYFPWLMAMSACAVTGPGGEPTADYELYSWRRNHEMVFKRRRGDGEGSIPYAILWWTTYPPSG